MFEVRMAKESEGAKIVSFQLEMAWETEQICLDRKTAEQGVAAVFADATKGCYWVAEQEGEVVAGLLAVPEWSDWRNGTVLWIHSLYVVPHARRSGAFRAMYEHLREMVETTPALKGLRLYVEKRNDRARQAYDAMGMTDQHYVMYEWMRDF